MNNIYVRRVGEDCWYKVVLFRFDGRDTVAVDCYDDSYRLEDTEIELIDLSNQRMYETVTFDSSGLYFKGNK